MINGCKQNEQSKHYCQELMQAERYYHFYAIKCINKLIDFINNFI